jgi:hypothetical protein
MSAFRIQHLSCMSYKLYARAKALMPNREAIDMRARRGGRTVMAIVSQIDFLHRYIFAWPAFAASESNCDFGTRTSPDISVCHIADLQKRGLSTTIYGNRNNK